MSLLPSFPAIGLLNNLILAFVNIATWGRYESARRWTSQK